ncbi:MAG: sigma-70 family RNA polymerase sigma factor [Gemmatimonadales bacterium]|jgi:RNA polymerase sigma-70 factor (ECF subfamily)|nr:MAG: sigma-70 family RNA polymerase sigma factor [Gemmatimonadales bacterium]
MPDESQRRSDFSEEALPEMDAIYRFALRLAGSRDAAEDLTQETYLRAYRSWDSFTPGTRVRSWLFTICRNVHLRKHDRARRHDEILTEVAEEDPRQISREAGVFMATRDRDPEGAFWDQIVDARILEAIDELPPDFREAVVLCDLEDLSYEEIGQVAGIPVGTVKSRVFRARRILQERLHAYAVETGILPPAREGAGRTTRQAGDR